MSNVWTALLRNWGDEMKGNTSLLTIFDIMLHLRLSVYTLGGETRGGAPWRITFTLGDSAADMPLDREL